MAGDLSGKCNESRQSLHITTVKLGKYVYDCNPCKKPCSLVTEAGGTQLSSAFLYKTCK